MRNKSTYEDMLKKNPKKLKEWKRGLKTYEYHKTQGDIDFKNPEKKIVPE